MALNDVTIDVNVNMNLIPSSVKDMYVQFLELDSYEMLCELDSLERSKEYWRNLFQCNIGRWENIQAENIRLKQKMDIEKRLTPVTNIGLLEKNQFLSDENKRLREEINRLIKIIT